MVFYTTLDEKETSTFALNSLIPKTAQFGVVR